MSPAAGVVAGRMVRNQEFAPSLYDPTKPYQGR